MKKYKVNPGSISERVVEASFFKIEGEYIWFFREDSDVASIMKAEFVNRIDHLG